MEFKNINSYTSAYKYAEKRGGVPKVPFAIFWEFFPEDEKRLVDVARQVQHTFNLVQSTEPFKIEEVEKIEEDLFEIEINPGGLIPFKIDQDSFEQQQTAQQIDKQLDAHQKKKEQKAPEKKVRKTSEKKVRKTSDELYNEFKSREEKILTEIREESLAKAKEEAAETLAKAKAEAEAKAAKAEEALVEALAEAKTALAEALAEAKAETEAAKAEAKTAKVETKVEAKATTLKIFGYTVFEYSK